MLWLVLIAVAIVAGTVSAVVGFGGAALMLPWLHDLVGVRDAVVALTVAQIVSNASRVWFNRREIDRPSLGWYVAGAVPMGVLGAMVFVAAPLRDLTWVIGVVLLALVVGRRAFAISGKRLKPRILLPVGIGSGAASALAGTAGPLAAPFFLAVGLRRGAYIGTEAAAALSVHLVKLPVYAAGGAVSVRGILVGVALAPAIIFGAWIGKRVVDRVSAGVFLVMVEVVLVVAGMRMILIA